MEMTWLVSLGIQLLKYFIRCSRLKIAVLFWISCLLIQVRFHLLDLKIFYMHFCNSHLLSSRKIHPTPESCLSWGTLIILLSTIFNVSINLLIFAGLCSKTTSKTSVCTLEKKSACQQSTLWNNSLLNYSNWECRLCHIKLYSKLFSMSSSAQG